MKNIRCNPKGEYPEIHSTSYVDPAAVIIGRVRIGKNVYVGPRAVIRADELKSRIIINDNCNVQDRVTMHALAGTRVEVRERTSLSHGCIVHGPCSIGKDCFIGFGSVVFNSKIGNGVCVKYLVVIEDVSISAGRIVPSGAVINCKKDAGRLDLAGKDAKVFMKKVVRTNLDLTKGYVI